MFKKTGCLLFVCLPIGLASSLAICGNKRAVESPAIVVDQFGYLPDATKIAVLRLPKIGFDNGTGVAPGPTIQLLNQLNHQPVYSASPVVWNNSKTDPDSGDQAWWFDFSSVRTPGTYVVYDQKTGLKSPPFMIGTDVYKKVLVQAVRTFFYQRSSFEKDKRFAGEAWADLASHNQDRFTRRFLDKSNIAAERDLHGGWYDAGDYNRYTQWTADYVVGLLRAYDGASRAFGDDTNIPESGNGVPDILDETKWGIDWLIRMQQPDGSVLSIVGVDSASPPSKALGPSFYGDANTISAIQTSAAFAYAGKVYGGFSPTKFSDYAKDLIRRAELSYAWAEENPRVIFRNNDGGAGTSGLGAGQQEVEDPQRLLAKLEAATYLFELTGKINYHRFFMENFQRLAIYQNQYVTPFDERAAEILLYYSAIPTADQATRTKIREYFSRAMNAPDHFPAFTSHLDPYLAHLNPYTWGSNSAKSSAGLLYADFSRYQVSPSREAEANQNAQSYLHYLHGLNPFGMVYLSNMGAFGATKSVSSFFHSWFCEDSPNWSRVSATTAGPSPGFLTGGPNPYYRVSECCPNSCGSDAANAKCKAESMSPPIGQPPMKSYKDFNASWPLDSWEVTENSNGYQVRFIRLLSRFVQ
jgi:endoglucanase